MFLRRKGGKGLLKIPSIPLILISHRFSMTEILKLMTYDRVHMLNSIINNKWLVGYSGICNLNFDRCHFMLLSRCESAAESLVSTSTSH